MGGREEERVGEGAVLCPSLKVDSKMKGGMDGGRGGWVSV